MAQFSFFVILIIVVGGIIIGIITKSLNGLAFILFSLSAYFITGLRRRWFITTIGPDAEREKQQAKREEYLRRKKMYFEGIAVNLNEMPNVKSGDRIELISDSKFCIAPGTTGTVIKTETLFKDNTNYKEVYVEWDYDLIDFETGTPIENAPLIVGLDKFEIIR